jgi:hypothetical protein
MDIQIAILTILHMSPNGETENALNILGFVVLKGGVKKCSIFWDITPCIALKGSLQFQRAIWRYIPAD